MGYQLGDTLGCQVYSRGPQSTATGSEISAYMGCITCFGFSENVIIGQNFALKELTIQLAMLVSLTNAAWVQALHLMDIKHLQKSKGELVFVLQRLINQSRPGHKDPTVQIKSYLLTGEFVFIPCIKNTSRERVDSGKVENFSSVMFGHICQLPETPFQDGFC